MFLDHLLTSSSTRAPLRVALIVEGGRLPRAYALAVDHVLRSDFAKIEVVVEERRAPPGGDAARAGRRSVLFDLYRRWDAGRAAAEAALLEPVAIDERLARVARISADVLEGVRELRYADSTAERLAQLDIDVAIRAAEGELAAEAAAFARYGVWSLRRGDAAAAGGAPYFRELAEGRPLSEIALVAVRSGSPSPLALCTGRASTCLDAAEMSATRNRVKPELLGSTFVIRKLRELHEEGFSAVESRGAPAAPAPPRDAGPSSWEVARFAVPRILRKAVMRAGPPRKVHWRIAVRVNGSPSLSEAAPFDLTGFRWIDPPRGRLYADPSLVEAGGQVFCFFEDLDHATGIGRISCATIDGRGELRDVQPALDLPHHLSYPFVLRSGGDYFMIPESRKNGSVDLFRAAEFPARWEKVRTLLFAPGLDTTVLLHEGRFWFFVTVREPPSAGEQLLLLSAPSLDGELRLHPRNPISTDARYCRSAGALFRDGGRLIRPSQDSSVTYGRQVHFHEVLRLTPDEYEERLVTTMAPPRGFAGVHTYNRCGAVEVIDGKRLEPTRAHVAPRRRHGAR